MGTKFLLSDLEGGGFNLEVWALSVCVLWFPTRMALSDRQRGRKVAVRVY